MSEIKVSESKLYLHIIQYGIKFNKELYITSIWYCIIPVIAWYRVKISMRNCHIVGII